MKWLLVSLLLGAAAYAARAEDTAAAEEKPRTVEHNKPELVKAGADGSLVLGAGNAELYGKELKVTPDGKAIGWWTQQDDYVAWQMEVPKAGTYEVWIEWSISDEWADNAFVVEAGDATVKGKIPKTGGFEHFKKEKFGKVDVKAGRQRLAMRADGPIKGEIADLRAITLVPAAAEAKK